MSFSFKSLPVKTRWLLGVGVVLALTLALPLFIWGILTQRFDIRERAQVVTPPVGCSTSPLTVDQSVSGAETTADYKAMIIFFRGKNTSDVSINYGDQYGYLQSHTWSPMGLIGASQYLVMTFEANGTRQVGTYPQADITITIDDSPITIRVPSFTIADETQMISFYIANDGSTYYASSTKQPNGGFGITFANILAASINLAPNQAFNSSYLGRCPIVESCTGQPDGTRCEGSWCPPNPRMGVSCRIFDGTCQNNICVEKQASPGPDLCPSGNVGNLNCDLNSLINSLDLALLLSQWRIVPPGTVCPIVIYPVGTNRRFPDLNGDCSINSIDLATLLANWKSH